MFRKALASIAFVALGSAAMESHAVVNGWFDAVNVAMTDTAYGWICDSSSPYSAPAGTLAVYLNGVYYTDYQLVDPPTWGTYRPDVPAAGFCSGNNYTGWVIGGYFAFTDSPIDIYYRHQGGSLQLLGGSGKICNVAGWCT